MAKRLLAASTLALILALGASAMPASFLDEEEGKSGWLSLGLRFFIKGEGSGERNIAFEFSGAGPERIGMGFELGASGIGQGFMIAISGLYYYDPFPSAYFTLPLKLRVGLFVAPDEANWLASLSGGALLFTPTYRYDEPDNPKEIALAGGGDGELYYFNGKLYPAFSLSSAFVARLGPNGGGDYYYVYY